VRLWRQDLSLRQLETVRSVGGKAQRTCPIARNAVVCKASAVNLTYGLRSLTTND
jgi:hypothetical protein